MGSFHFPVSFGNDGSVGHNGISFGNEVVDFLFDDFDGTIFIKEFSEVILAHDVLHSEAGPVECNVVRKRFVR